MCPTAELMGASSDLFKLQYSFIYSARLGRAVLLGDELSIDELLQSLSSREPEKAWATFLEAYAPVILQTVRLFEHESDAVADCFLFACEGLAKDRFRRLRRFRSSGPARFPTWLRVVVRNLCIDWRRKKFGRPRNFEFVSRLPALDHEVFRCVHEDGNSQEEAFLRLSPHFPGLSRQAVAESAQRGLELTSARQRWLLRVRHADKADDSAEALENVPDERPGPESSAISDQLQTRLQQVIAGLPEQERLLLQLRFEQDLTLEQIAHLLHLGDAQRVDRRIQPILARLREELD